MKVTRDKTQSVDLGNGLSLRADRVLIITHKGTTKEIARLDGDKWAEEIFAKHFTPITITLETEDEACTLWHLLNYGRDSAEMVPTNEVKPDQWRDSGMYLQFDKFYAPRWKNESR